MELKEQRKAQNKKFYKNNKKQLNLKHKEYNTSHKIQKRNRDLKRLYGITLEQYNEMLKNQNNVCAICGEKEKSVDSRTMKLFSLAVDHDHKTGKVRKLLCSVCNKILGLANDNTSLIEKIKQYIINH